jgi:hypothetical protein
MATTARLSALPLLELEAGSPTARVSALPLLELDAGLPTARVAALPLLVLRQSFLEAIGGYPAWQSSPIAIASGA